MYREITEEVQVDAYPEFVREESRPEASYYFFSYRIRIKNLSPTPKKLLARHWVITDGRGMVREVVGDGVVGKQPLLNPGDEFEYTSFCPLPTPTGNMRGTYEMVDENGARFKIKIPLFFLRDAALLH
jgi:ApaG protein